MENIGETLRNKRYEKMLTLKEIEQNTRIRRRYLEAMENEEWDIFPGLVYLKGFVKTYCRYLGLDEKDIIIALEGRLTPSPPAQPLPEKIDLPGRPRRKVAFLLGFIAIIVLLVSHFIYTEYFDLPLTNPNAGIPSVTDNGDKTPPPPADPAVSPTGDMSPGVADNNPGNPAAVENTPTELKSLSLRIKVINYKCWVIVKNGTQLVFEGTMQKGEEKMFTDLPEIYMGLGNAGDVEVYINEEKLDLLGGKGEVVYKKFVIENNAIKETDVALPTRTVS